LRFALAMVALFALGAAYHFWRVARSVRGDLTVVVARVTQGANAGVL